jgi:hypothetical protein
VKGDYKKRAYPRIILTVISPRNEPSAFTILGKRQRVAVASLLRDHAAFP